MPSKPALLRHAYQTTFCKIRRPHSSGLVFLFSSWRRPPDAAGLNYGRPSADASKIRPWGF